MALSDVVLSVPPVVLTALYVPGDRPDRFDKAARSGADVVILDLEDSVTPAAKQQARDAVSAWLFARSAATPDQVGVQVRVNALGSPWSHADLAMLRAAPGLADIRVPKVGSAEDLDEVVAQTGPGAALHVLVESAQGVESVSEIARHAAVATVGLGEADLASELGTTGDGAMAWVRSRLVVAARAAGLPAPLQSVHADIADLGSLERSCRAAKALGLMGRAAIHPRQLAVIARAYRPAAAEVDWAREALGASADAATAGRGVAVLTSGAMVDRAMLPRARQILAVEAAAARTLARIEERHR